jgi:hypothetical protein
MEIEIDGAKGIATVASAVRSLGADRKIVTEMAKEIRAAVPPIRTAVRANAIAYLPGRNGLGPWVAKGSVTARIKRGANDASVTIVDGRNSTGGRTDMKAINAGKVRHPAWGNKKAWSMQTVRPGFFTNAITEEGADAFREAVIRAADNAAAKVLEMH